MQIRNFIKINKTVILIFLIIEIILCLCFYFFIKSEVTDEVSNLYSEININSHEALKVVKNEHEKKMQEISKDEIKYGYIKTIKYTHNYEKLKGVFCAVVETSSGECFLYEISSNMKCVIQREVGWISYEDGIRIFKNDRDIYLHDIYNDYKDNISEWKVAEID